MTLQTCRLPKVDAPGMPVQRAGSYRQASAAPSYYLFGELALQDLGREMWRQDTVFRGVRNVPRLRPTRRGHGNSLPADNAVGPAMPAEKSTSSPPSRR